MANMMNQSELAAIFQRMQREYYRMNDKQSEWAIKELRRVQSETQAMLAEMAGPNGVIKRERFQRIQRELIAIENDLYKHGEVVIHKIMKDSTGWTTEEINRRMSEGFGTQFMTQADIARVNRNVFEYSIKRFYGDSNLVLSGRIWNTSGNIITAINNAIRTGIIQGKSIGEMTKSVRNAYNAETWQIKRMVVTEGSTAYRTAAAWSAEESELVDWVQMHRGVADRPNHECTILSKEDRYGMGEGIFKPTDSELYNPHPNCTGYITYVVDDYYTLDAIRARNQERGIS